MNFSPMVLYSSTIITKKVAYWMIAAQTMDQANLRVAAPFTSPARYVEKKAHMPKVRNPPTAASVGPKAC